MVGLDSAGRLAGFAAINLKSGYLDQLCNAPAERGRAWPRRSYEAKRKSPGVIELDVNQGNGRALRSHEREGFSVVGRGLKRQSGLPTLKRCGGPKRTKVGRGSRRLRLARFPAIAMG